MLAVDVAVTWSPYRGIMGDKHKSEIQKPVKNTLLSGASHGFPFESFQGNSLLIPVSQNSPSVLNDSFSDVGKLETKEFAHSENVAQITDTAVATTLEGPNPNVSKPPPQTMTQGYTGIFSSFFGGGQQKKQDSDSNQSQGKNSDRPSLPPPQSNSPFNPVPNIQSFTPTLRVPTTTSDQPQNNIPINSAGFSDPSNLQNRNQSFQAATETPLFYESNQNLTNTSMKPTENFSGSLKEPVQANNNQIQNLFDKYTSESDLGFLSETSPDNIGFETFSSPLSKSFSPRGALFKTQSAIELTDEKKLQLSSNSTPYNLQNTNQFYQKTSESADSFATNSHPPFGVSSTLSGPLLVAPPLSSTSRNYRRDHHKRLTYAPVPGLTSNTAVSTSYLQPRENLCNLSSSVSSQSLSSGASKQPLSASFSQPALNLSEYHTDSSSVFNPQSVSLTSLNSQFSSVTLIASQSTLPDNRGIQTTASTNGLARSDSSVITFTSSGFFDKSVSQFSSYSTPPTHQMGSTYLVSSTVHPTIMSSKEVSPRSPSIHMERTPSPMVIPQSLNNLSNLGSSGIIYRPVYHHWFVRIEAKDSKEIWQPFSMTDSLALEQAFNSESLTPDTVVSTDGGRYDVNITNRTRNAVYWEEEEKPVRRCSWFYKNATESRLHPYDENIAYNLEEEYKKAVTTNSWNRKVDLPTGDFVYLYGLSSMVQVTSLQTPDEWEAETDYQQPTQHRPKIVKRGVLDDFEIDEGESPLVDHLVFVVHGIGAVCDLKFRNIQEAVDGFRSKSLQLLKSHFLQSMEQNIVNRVEILPVSWHNQLHGENTGVDKKLQSITLKSIPKLRHFTNDTLLDILFYTSPVYCQNIVQQVGREISTLYAKFKSRNPSFKGGVSLVGHSLGSLILFDMLCHQTPFSPRMENIKEVSKTNIVEHEITTLESPGKKKHGLNRNLSYVIGNAGTGQPFIEYPQLPFQPTAFFAMGSPIGMFVTVRGIDSLGLDFCLPTCSRFFNIFHPFDPVAYRIEALINPDLAGKRPVLIPHHKGRKRMHLELKETMARVGADLKQRLVDSVRSTWNAVYQLTMFGRADDELEQEVDQVIEKQLERQRTEGVDECIGECEDTEFNAGLLNQGKRIDYVLQEAPLESFNEYVSALTSHVIYWDSEDTMLLILKEIYGSMGISADNQGGVLGLHESIGSPFPSQNPNKLPANTGTEQRATYGF